MLCCLSRHIAIHFQHIQQKSHDSMVHSIHSLVLMVSYPNISMEDVFFVTTVTSASVLRLDAS